MTKRFLISDNDYHDRNVLLPGGGDPCGGGVDAAVGSVASDEVTGMPPATAAARMMALPLRAIKFGFNLCTGSNFQQYVLSPLIKPSYMCLLFIHSPVRGPVTRCSCD